VYGEVEIARDTNRATAQEWAAIYAHHSFVLLALIPIPHSSSRHLSSFLLSAAAAAAAELTTMTRDGHVHRSLPTIPRTTCSERLKIDIIEVQMTRVPSAECRVHRLSTSVNSVQQGVRWSPLVGSTQPVFHLQCAQITGSEIDGFECCFSAIGLVLSCSSDEQSSMPKTLTGTSALFRLYSVKNIWNKTGDKLKTIWNRRGVKKQFETYDYSLKHMGTMQMLI